MFSGFPPPDHDIRDLLTGSKEDGKEMHLMIHFLTILFEKTKSVLETDLVGANSRSERITTFRDYMTTGQNFERVGHRRQAFYKDIVRKVDEVSYLYRLTSFIFSHFTEDQEWGSCRYSTNEVRFGR